MRCCQNIFFWLGLGLLFLAAPLSAAVRFNEVLFAPGGGNAPDEEFIELYNDGPGNVDLQGWKLLLGENELYEFPDALPLAAGEYLVVYIGSPAAPPLNSISLGYDAEQLDDFGADILLENDVEQPIDYVAYGNVVAHPPAPLVFASPVSLASPWQTGDSIAYLEQDGTSSDDYRQWINRRGTNITPGAANTRQTEPTLSYGTVIVPANFPVVDACDEIEVPLEISYSDETPLRDVTVEFIIPTGFFYVSASDGGIFVDATRTISWSLGNLNDDRSVSLRLRGGSQAVSDSFPATAATVGYRRYINQSPLTADAANAITGITVQPASVEVSILHYPSGEPAIVAKPGLVVEFQIVVTNNGPGALLNTCSLLELSASAHSLSLLAFRQNGPTGPPIDNLLSDIAAGTFSGNLGTIDAGDSKIFYLKLLTIGCPIVYACTKATVTWGCADEAPGTLSCSNTIFNTGNVYCPPEVHFLAPPGEPAIYSGCHDVKRQVVVRNPNTVPIEPLELQLQIPEGYYWIASTINGIAAGTYDQANGKVAFMAAELGPIVNAAGRREIEGNKETIIDLIMRPSCTAVSDRVLSGNLDYQIVCPMRTFHGKVIEQSPQIKLQQPALSVAVQNPHNPLLTTVEAERGQLVTFHVAVSNNGLGNLNSSGKPLGEEGGWVELGQVGSGLQLDSVADITGGGVGVPVTPITEPDIHPHWPTGAINAGGKRIYEVKFRVMDCTDVSYDIGTYWTCEGTHEDDQCRQEGESKGSVNIILRNPLLSIAVDPFTIDYCEGTTVTIPVTNADGAGIGSARNVSINMYGLNLTDYEISDDENSDFEVEINGNIATFNLVKGVDSDADGDDDDMAKNSTTQLIFTVKLRDGHCSAASSGELIFQPYYEDSCNIPFTTGTMLGSFSRTSPPEATLTKTGPGSAQVGDKNLTWNIELTYNGTPNDPFSYTLIDNYPSAPHQGAFATFTVQSVSDSSGPLIAGVDYTDDGDIITRTVTTNFDADGNYSETYTIVFDAPDTPCAGGYYYTNQSTVNILVPAVPVDCNDCQMWTTENSNATIAIYNADEPEINRHARRVTYENLNVHGLNNDTYQEAGETCTKIIFDHLVQFTGSAPANWEVDVDPDPNVEVLRSVLLYDHLDNRLRAPSDIKSNLAVEVYYFSAGWEPGTPIGNDYGPGGGNLITWDDITYVSPGQGSGYLQINLKGLDALNGAGPNVPSDQGILWIRYTVESQQATGEMYGDFARVSVPNIGGDLCGLGPETHYYQFVPVRVVDPEATVSISNTSSPDSRHIDRCETATYRFTLGSEDGRPFDHYDVRLVVDLQGNYRYIPNSTVFGSNLRDEGGQPLVAFEPVIDGDRMIWNLGDLRGLHSGSGRYVEIDVEKDCGQESTLVGATVYNNVMCNQVEDTNGAGQATQQDSAIAGLTSFSHDDSDSYEPHLYTGRLETLFANSKVYYNDGYPAALIHVVNSGNGALYNVRVPVELGSLINGTASLTFVEAKVTAVSGQASVTPGTVLTPVVFGQEYAHGYREITLGIDSMTASTVVTIELRLRMVLCQDLSLRIVKAHWGCPAGEEGSCLENLEAPELNSYMNILSGNAKGLIVEHKAEPSVIDLCGSTTRMSIEVINAGGVDVYEPTIRERLPEGMVVEVDSVRYSINGGALKPFPEASGPGLRYSSLVTSTTPGLGDYQTLMWVFTDPNLDGDEADSLLDTVAYNDPYPDDTYFNRHKVLKPGTRIRIEFNVVLSGCANALAYSKSSRLAEATLLFDLPCHHDNRIYPDGTAVPEDRRFPLDDSTHRNSFLEPGLAHATIDMAGKNMTQDGALTFSQVNGEKEDQINWYITINSIGIGAVPDPTLEIFIPNVLAVDFANAPPVLISPANLTFTNANPTGVPHADGFLYTFAFDNSDPAMIAAGREHYFAATDQIQITFSSTVAQCSDEKPLVEAVINWGCCLDTPGLENASGSDHASTAVKTRPDSPIITVSEGDGGLLPAFDSCLGAYTITMTNPVLNNQLYLHEIDVTMVLPAGWTYAPLNGDGADFRYEGTGAREEDDRLTAAEEEPLIDGQTLRWTSVSRGGNIPDAKAKLFPVEVVKIVVYLRADGTGVNCDLDGKANPPVPAFVQSISLANYEDSCGDKLDSPRNANVSIVPKHPTLSISLIPSTRFINSTTTEVEWALRIQNIGDKDADNIDLEIDFGSGYSNVILKNGTPAPTSLTGNKGTWDLGVIGTVVPEQILLWTFTATIDTVNRGPLQVKAAVNGYCLERDGSLGCPYSFSEAEEFISGAMIDKVIDGTRLASPAVSTDPAPNSAAAKAADVAIGSIVRYLITVNVYEGGSNDLIVRDVLPVGLGFLEAYLVDHNGAWVADLNSTVTGDNTRVFSHVTNPSLAGITGGRLGNNALFLEIWAQVLDLPQNQEGIELENTAQLTVKRGNQTFDHNSPGLGLFESNKLTILEPHIQDDQYLTKTSEPTSLTPGHVGPELDLDPKPDGDNPIKYVFTARNTGSSPAYEVEFTDLFPWQLQNPTSLTSPYELLVEIEPAGGGTARQLTASTDFTSSWTAGTKPNPATFKVNLLNTAAARLGIDETLRITYYGQVEYFAPGTFVDNLAKITSYSSLPGDGATLTTAKNTSLAESADERDNYANGYRDITERRTYHKFTTELISYGKIKSEITPHSDGVPPEFRDDGTTRATIGEQVEYWIRLSLPMTISLADLTLACDIPDGLTVRDAQWEVVTVGGDFSGGEKALSATKVGAITEVRGQAGAGADDFAQPLENMTNQDQELLIKLFLTVDRNYSGGASVLKGDSFDLPATFTWDNNEYTDSVDPIPQFTIVEPRLIALTKERTAHLQADNVTAATSPGTASYKNYYAIGPDNGSNATETVDDVYQVRPTDIIEYTVTFENDGDGAAWDIELRDLIPAGMTLRAGSTTISTTPADAGLVITEPILPGTPFFAINRVLPEHEVTVTYRCNVDSNVAAGRYLQNQVDLQQYSSLPAIGVAYPDEDRSVTSGDAAAYDAQGPRFEKLGTEYPTALKTVAAEMTLPANDGTVQGTIGELMTYTITVDIPDTTVLNDLTFLDVVPDGLEVKNASYVYNGGAQVNLTVTVNADGTSSVADTGGSLGDLAGVNGVTGELVITIAAMVKQKFNTATGATDNGPFGVGAANGIIDAGDIFKNNANFTWNQVNDEVTANTLDAEPQPVEFVIVEPKLEDLTKTKVSFNPAAFLGKGDGYRNYDVFGPNPENSGLVNDVDQVQPGHIVEYTLTITNNGDAIAYDVALFDRLNEFMTYVNGSASATVGPNATNMNFVVTPYTGLNTDLHFSLSQLEPGNTATVKYQLQVDVPVPAGRYLLNTVNLASCNSLPVAIAQYPDNVRRLEPRLQIGGPPDDPGYPRLDVAWADVGTLFPTATKTVQSEISPPAGKLDDGTARGTIGEMMTYEVLIDLPDNTIVYDLLLEDVIPANLTVQTETLDQPPVTLSFADVNSNGIITRYPLGSNELTISGNTVRLYLESDVQATNSFTNEIRLVLAVTVDDVPANVAGTVFANAVTTSWTQRDENPGYPAAREWLNEFTTPEGGTVDFTIIEPLLANNALTKARTGHFLANGSAAAEIGYSTYRNYNAVGPVTHTAKQDPVPNVYQVRPTDIVEYTLTFENTGDARAYDIALLDVVPVGFTLLSVAPHAPTITADSTAGIDFLDNPPTQATTGDPVEMKVNWLDAGDTATITLRMQIEPGIAAGAYLQNQASIEDYGTTPDATAVFPDLERDTTSTVPYAKPDPKFEKVGSEYPVTSKTVQTELTAPPGKFKDGSSRATIGELITYEIRLDIKDDLVMFDTTFSDLMPDGLDVVNAVYSIKGGPEVSLSIAPQGNGTTLVTDTATPLADLTAQNGLTDEVIFTITATVKQKFVSGTGATDQGTTGIVDDGDIFANNATFTWNQLDNEATLNTQNAELAPITLTILEPKLDDTFTKVLVRVLDADGGTEVTTSRGHAGVVSDGVVPAAVDGKTSYFRYPAGGGNPTLVEDVQVVLPDDFVEYQIEVKNTGTATAFDLLITDILPPQAALTYVSGTGDFAMGTTPYTSGSADSILTVSTGVESVAGVDHTKLTFQIDMLAAGETAQIIYRAQVSRGLGAGYYIGMNVANLEDYSSLPDGTFTIDVGNLASGDTVHDHTGERNASSDPAYSKQGPKGDDVGVQYPEFGVKIYRRYDVHGTLTDTELTGTTQVRIGDILIHELIATLPRHTTLFDGGAAGSKAMAYRHRLNRGYHLIPGTEEFDTGDIDLTTLHHADSPTTPHYVSGNYQYPTWYFSDIANDSNDSQTAILRFQSEIRTVEHTGAGYFTDQTVSVSSASRSYLYWNTIDAAEKATLSSSTSLNAGDHPFLQRDSVNTAVVQPNLQLFKTSNPLPDSIIGVTSGVGDTVIYTLTLRNWNSSNAGEYRGRGIAYDIELTDLLPKDLAPVPPAEPLLTAVVHNVNSGTGATAAAQRTLVRDSDYTYVYDFDPVTRQGSISFKTIRDETNVDYDARVEANQALVITYEVVVNPEIGAQGIGAGLRVNLAQIEKYQSLPATINDASRKEYGPEGPRRVALLTDIPTIDKDSATANGSVLPGTVIEYTLTAPGEMIRANLYEVEIRDELPDGLTFGADGTVAGVSLVPADILALNVGDGAGLVAGNEIEVTGIKGNATITINGRVLSIQIDQIEPEGGADQVTITVRALVKAQLDNGLPFNRLHEFRNLATLFWYDADDTYTLRARHASMSNAVSHFFDARGILFEPSHTGTAQPATIRTYRHWLRNFEENDLTVPIDFSAIQPDWIWQLFIGDGEGNVVSGPFESGHAVPVAANGATEVIMRVFVPAEITSMTTDVLTITATGAGDNVITVTDVTVVQVERVAVFKEISTTGDYVTRLEVQPADNNNINQRIRFVNNGPEPVKNVYVYDFIPENTAYVANSAVNNAEFNLEYSKDGGVNWLPGEPAAQGETVTNGLVPKVTNLRWNYDSGGTLIPGEEKIITFQLRIK